MSRYSFGECFAPRFRRYAIKPLFGVLPLRASIAFAGAMQ